MVNLKKLSREQLETMAFAGEQVLECYRVLEAEDGPAALKVLNDDPDIDLLLTDVVMPGGMSGAELASKARERRPDLKVLYTSGYTENAILHRAMLDEGVEMIGKPYRKDELARKVRQVLGR